MVFYHSILYRCNICVNKRIASGGFVTYVDSDNEHTYTVHSA